MSLSKKNHKLLGKNHIIREKKPPYVWRKSAISLTVTWKVLQNHWQNDFKVANDIQKVNDTMEWRTVSSSMSTLICNYMQKYKAVRCWYSACLHDVALYFRVHACVDSNCWLVSRFNNRVNIEQQQRRVHRQLKSRDRKSKVRSSWEERVRARVLCLRVVSVGVRRIVLVGIVVVYFSFECVL